MTEQTWAELLKEVEPFEKELDEWLKITRSTSRLEIYQEIDGYPISNIGKMHIAGNKILYLGALKPLLRM